MLKRLLLPVGRSWQTCWVTWNKSGTKIRKQKLLFFQRYALSHFYTTNRSVISTTNSWDKSVQSSSTIISITWALMGTLDHFDHLLKILTLAPSNIYRRNLAIGAFKGEDSKARVIMLSLASAASGTNLMEATHVFLMGNCLPFVFRWRS